MTVVDAHLHVWDPAVAAYDWLGSAMAPVDRAMRFREARGVLRTDGVGAAVLAQAADHDAGTDRMPVGANVCSRASVWDDADSLYVPCGVEIGDVVVVGGGSAPEAYGAAWPRSGTGTSARRGSDGRLVTSFYVSGTSADCGPTTT